MNRELRRVSVITAIMFSVLLVAATIIQYGQAGNLAADGRNARALYKSSASERGPILVAGSPIASSERTANGSDFAFQRKYANGPLYSAVTGFYPTGANGEPTGLERGVNSLLSGQSSSQFFDHVNSIISGQAPMGASVETTINPELQQAAWDALGDKRGAVIVTEPSSGKILAMVSKPTFDPNSLTSLDSKSVYEEYNRLNEDPSQPLINRAIGGDMNPPGSVFKLVVTSAALESGKYTAESTFPNPASYTLPGSNAVIYNSDRGQCGPGDQVTIADALRLSCNIPFAQLGIALGYKAILDQAEKFGFNRNFTIPQTTGTASYPKVLDEPQTGLSAFGQGNVRATPLAINMVTSALANGGIVMEPTLVDRVVAPNLSPIEEFQAKELGRAVSEETAKTMTALMVNNVQNGAASNARIDGVSVAGKTGTAENGTGAPYTLWYTGFAPANAPKYAITVLVEDGGGMGQEGYGNLLAAPIAKQVLKGIFK